LRRRFAPLTRDWPRPSLDGLRWLARASVGSWFGAFGWKLLSMSNNLVLTVTGSPELVPLYSCTARLSVMLLQVGWIVPDSGLVGLAQLYGEGRTARLREVTRAMLRLHLMLAGGAATIVLAINPAFVSWWVSEAMFGGHWLNLLLAGGIAIGSIAHALATICSVLGRRLEIGFITMANGAVQVAAACALTFAIGFQGIAAAAILAAAVTTVPVGLRLLAALTGVGARALLSTLTEWSCRALPAFAAALGVGIWVPAGAVWLATAAWVPIGCLYVWMIRPLYAELPLDPRFRSVLAALRLLPQAEATTVAAPELVV
jgi:O-antigen/teichoic acid export membrane protein